MKFVIEPMTEELSFASDQVWTLCIKPPGVYRQMIESLQAYYYRRQEGTGIRLLDDGGQLMDISKNTLLIHDSYTFDVTSRPIIAALLKDLQNRSILDDSVLQHIEKSILDLMGELDLQSGNKLIYKPEVDLTDVLKMMDVRLAASEYYGLVDKMYSIIELAGNLLAKQLVIFINHRCLLTPGEFVGLAEFARHQALAVLFIDNIDTEIAIDECRMMVDEDLYCYMRKT